MGAVAAAFVVHPTTALWFGVWMGVALIVVRNAVAAVAACAWLAWRLPARRGPSAGAR